MTLHTVRMLYVNLNALILISKPPITMTDHPYGIPHNERAERLNGRLAMLGVIAAIGAYALTGQLIPGIW